MKKRKKGKNITTFFSLLFRYVIPLDPSLIPPDKKYISKIEDRKDVVSIWAMKVEEFLRFFFSLIFFCFQGSLKADLREFVVRRLFGVVLNFGYLKLLEQLLSTDIQLLAGWFVFFFSPFFSPP